MEKEHNLKCQYKICPTELDYIILTINSVKLTLVDCVNDDPGTRNFSEFSFSIIK